MRTTVQAVHERGVLRLLGDLHLAEHERVTVTVEKACVDTSGDGANAMDALAAIAGRIPADDLAEMESVIESGCERIDADSWK